MNQPVEFGGVRVHPNPPVAGKDVTITVSNKAGTIYWRIAPDGPEQKVEATDGKATITIPAGAAGKSLSIHAGDPPDVVSERFDVIDI